MLYCINQNHCGNTNLKWEEYITGIPHRNYVSGVVVHKELYNEMLDQFGSEEVFSQYLKPAARIR